MAISARLWSECECSELRRICELHPFVLGLATSTLPLSAFQAYVAQDAFFLRAFKDGYSKAATLALDGGLNEASAKFLTLRDAVDNELHTHSSYAASLNIDIEHVQPLTQAIEYVSFLRAAGEQNNLSVLCAAMCPCMRLYAHLGTYIQSTFGLPNSPFTEWVQTYSAIEFAQSAQELEALLDASLSPEISEDGQCEEHVYSNLVRVYSAALRLEIGFFDGVPFKCTHSGLPVTSLCVDFDDTITASDTTNSLLRECVMARDGQCVDSDPLYASLQALVANYFTEYQAFMEPRLVMFEEKQIDESTLGIEREPNLSQYFDFAEECEAFERRMVEVVEASGILQGINTCRLESLGLKTILAPSALHTLEYARAYMMAQAHQYAEPSLHIISVNWSSVFVRQSLQFKSSVPSLVGSHVGAVKLHCNDLQMETKVDSDGKQELVSTGNLVKRLTGPLGKRNIVKTLKSKLHLKDGRSEAVENGNDGNTQVVRMTCNSPVGSDNGMLVYVGDSANDLAAMLEADVGIVVGNSKSFRRVCKAFGISVIPVAHLVAQSFLIRSGHGTGSVPSRRCIYNAQSWVHIGCALFGEHFKRNWLSQTRTNEELSWWSKGQPRQSKERHAVPRALIMSGSDSGGGAGMQADLKACQENGVFACSSLTAITAQNTLGVQAIFPIPAEFVEQQSTSVLGDIGASVIKTGMLPSIEIVKTVARVCVQYKVPNLVVDPVMIATSGHNLVPIDQEYLSSIKTTLFPLATVLTPNIHEASKLTGVHIATLSDQELAASLLHALGPAYVLVKGGHMNDSSWTTDVLFDGNSFTHFQSPRVKTNNTHGTGCTLASAIAAGLAKGYGVRQAIEKARAYVISVIAWSESLCIGLGAQGPMCHNTRTYWCSRSANEMANHLKLYAVTDTAMILAHKSSVEAAVEEALAGGATIVQLREKELDTAAFIEVAARVKQVTQSYGVPLIINDRVDVALAVDADGVHVGQDDMCAATVRAIIGRNKIVGVSAKTPAQALKAETMGADYVGTGAVFPTSTKDSLHIGLEGLVDVCRSISIPAVGIGGISRTTAESVIAHGAAGVAVVSAIFNKDDMRQAAKDLREVVDEALGRNAAR